MTTQTVKYAATSHMSIFNGTVTLYGFGRMPDEPELNWSLKGIETSTDPSMSHGHIVHTLGRLGVEKVYAPSPDTFNSQIATIHEFESPEIVPITLNETTSLYRGIKADGISKLPMNSAFAMSAADCALVVISFQNSIWVTHAGRDSLLDRKHINEGILSKEHTSVIDAIMGKIDPDLRSDAKAYIGFTISKGPHFQHSIHDPAYGEKNKLMLDWITSKYIPDNERNLFEEDFWTSGQIDMEWLIRKQLGAYGVTNIESDGICTYSEKGSHGNHNWFSQRRTPGMRNLLVAVRN
jgi:copper oxidase (laccase) domain-containing protein